jgi:hypothetical protein
MGRTSDFAALGEGILAGLQPYIDAKYEQGLKRDEARVYAKRLVEMSKLPEGFTEDDTNFLIGEMSRTVDPRTLQATLDHAASGGEVLEINMGSDQGGNRLGESNIHWSIPILSSEKTESSMNRNSWQKYNTRVTKLMKEGATHEDASTRVLKNLLSTDAAEISKISRHVYGSQSQTHHAREQAGVTVGLLRVVKNEWGQTSARISDTADEKLPKFFPNIDFSKMNEAQKINLILNHPKSPAFSAYAVMISAGMAGLPTGMDAFTASAEEAQRTQDGFRMALNNALSPDETYPESVADMPRIVKDKIRDRGITKSKLQQWIADDRSGPKSIFIRKLAIDLTTGVEESRQAEIQRIVSNYLNSLLDD